MSRLTSARFIARSILTDATRDAGPAPTNLGALARDLEGGLGAARVADVLAEAGVKLDAGLEGAEYVAFTAPGEPARSARRFGWLVSDDGREAVVRVDHQTTATVASHLVERVSDSRAARREAVEARAREAMSGVFTTGRQDLSAGALEPHGNGGAGGEFKLNIAYQASLGRPSDAELRKVIAARAPGAEFLDAESRRPGLITAFIRAPRAEGIDGITRSAARAPRAEDANMRVEEAVRHGGRAIVRIRWDQAKLRPLDERNLRWTVRGFLERYIGQNEDLFGHRGQARIRIDIDPSRGRAVALVPVTSNSALPEEVVVAKSPESTISP